MRPVSALTALAAVALATFVEAQTQRTPARRPAQPPPAATMKVAAEMVCPAPLGVGINTRREFCDVLSGRDPREGIIITLPPHRGDVTLTFDLHNRHTYSEEQVKAKRAYSRYTAVIGALTLDNTLISRAVVQSEFRAATDLLDRIGGGAGPGGVKAVAPTGTEAIVITIPAAEQRVSILGERLSVDRPDGTAHYTAPGRPVAVISNVMIEYRPGPAPKPPAAKPAPPRKPGA
jgi:hypothetical protein